MSVMFLWNGVKFAEVYLRCPKCGAYFVDSEMAGIKTADGKFPIVIICRLCKKYYFWDETELVELDLECFNWLLEYFGIKKFEEAENGSHYTE